MNVDKVGTELGHNPETGILSWSGIFHAGSRQSLLKSVHYNGDYSDDNDEDDEDEDNDDGHNIVVVYIVTC